MQTLSLKGRGPVWRDGAVLNDTVRARALPLVATAGAVRVTPESPATPAGWETLEQAIGTLRAVFPDEEIAYDGDAEPLLVLYRRTAEPGLPEPV